MRDAVSANPELFDPDAQARINEATRRRNVSLDSFERAGFCS